VTTAVVDDATGQAWSGSEQTGASAHDTASITGQLASFPASGTVTYTFFGNGSCTALAKTTQTVTVNPDGSVPNSNSTGPLTAGSYAFQAAYSGDGNYANATSACEPFTVVQPVSQITGDDTTCRQFAGNAGEVLSMVQYSTRRQTISQDDPGGFAYWVKVTVTSAGPQNFVISQSTTYAPTTGNRYFRVDDGSGAYDGKCHDLRTRTSTTISGGYANTRVSFTAAAAGTYYIGLEYSTRSIIGSGPASATPGFSYQYTFMTNGVLGSRSSMSLTHGRRELES
jgi:hypothetical protein